MQAYIPGNTCYNGYDGYWRWHNIVASERYNVLVLCYCLSLFVINFFLLMFSWLSSVRGSKQKIASIHGTTSMCNGNRVNNPSYKLLMLIYSDNYILQISWRHIKYNGSLHAWRWHTNKTSTRYLSLIFFCYKHVCIIFIMIVCFSELK